MQGSELIGMKITVEIHPALWDAEYGTKSREERREDVADFIEDLIANSDATNAGAIVMIDTRRKVDGKYI